ncbi:MAG TPA: MaoC family dehydratase [Methylophaga sp.]|nr:MaoC family dehydratase [Methylophaga sp.]
MGNVASFKKNRVKYQSTRIGLFNKFESTIRHWPETFNKKFVASRDRSLFLGQCRQLFDNVRHANVLIGQDDALATVHARLKRQLGQETYLGQWYTVDQSCINQFANATGDQQWIHIDSDRAKKESLFKTTIAHGFLTLALIPILTESIDPDKTAYPEAKMVVNYGLNRVRFPYPVKAGKRIRARTRVIDIAPMKRGLEIVREVTIEIEGSIRTACVAEIVLRLYF